MKKFNFLSVFMSALMILAFVMMSCTKEGQPGAEGPAGSQGPKGEDGINGTDGTAGCVQCHNTNQTMVAVELQWEHSIHATGGNFERNDVGCAVCHTSQGFLERMANGTQTTAAPIANPNPPNCYTCHSIHKTYTPDDWSLTYADPVALWFPAGETVDYGEGNLCANCHQARIVSPVPVPGSSDTYQMKSSRYGTHHSPVANMLAGVGGYEVSNYENSMHGTLVEDGCVNCHMASAYGWQAGGHTTKIEYEFHGATEVNLAGCTSCHSDTDELATLLEETQTEISGMIDNLRTILKDKGWLGDDDLFKASSSAPLSLTADELGACLNFQMTLEDKSNGVHNYKYTKALLENSIAALGGE